MGFLVKKLKSKWSILYNYITVDMIRLIAFFTLIFIIYDLFISGIFILIWGQLDQGSFALYNMDLFDQFVFTVVLGPIIETIIFHFLLMELLLFIFQRTRYVYHITIFINAFLFSLTHNYSMQYLIVAFFAGVLLASAYIIAKNHKMVPFIVVLYIHVFSNFIRFLLGNV